MSNLIFVYNGTIPDFSNLNNQNKFGPCYSVYQTANTILRGPNCILVVNLSQRPSPPAGTDIDPQTVSSSGASGAASGASRAQKPFGEGKEWQKAELEKWVTAHKSQIIKIPIVIFDLCLFGFKTNLLLYDSHKLLNTSHHGNISAVYHALKETDLLDPFVTVFMRGVLGAGHHVAKSIAAKNLLAIFARYVFGGCTADTTTIPHIKNSRDINNMQGNEHDYARLNKGFTGASEALVIARFLQKLDQEKSRSGAPCNAYNLGGNPSEVYNVWYYPQYMPIPIPVEDDNTPAIPNVFGQPLYSLDRRIFYPLNEDDFKTVSAAKNANKNPRQTEPMIITPPSLTEIDIFFNFAPFAYPGTLYSLLAYVSFANFYPRGWQVDAETGQEMGRLSAYNRERHYSTVAVTTTEHLWHIIDAQRQVALRPHLFPLPEVRSEVTYLIDALYFPTLYQPTRLVEDFESIAHSSWATLGTSIHILYQQDGHPTGLVKVMNQTWKRGSEHDPDPLVSPRDDRYHTFSS